MIFPFQSAFATPAMQSVIIDGHAEIRTVTQGQMKWIPDGVVDVQGSGAYPYADPISSIISDIDISSSAHLPLNSVSLTPNICTAAEMPPNPLFVYTTIKGISIGTCLIKVSNTGDPATQPLSQEVEIDFSIGHQYLQLNYAGNNFVADSQSNISHGSQIQIIGRKSAANIGAKQITDAKDTVTIMTPKVCSVARDDYQNGGYGYRGYRISSRKLGECKLQYKSTGTNQYQPLSVPLSFTFKKTNLSVNGAGKKKILNCVRTKDSIYEIVEFPAVNTSGQTSTCPAGYLADHSIDYIF